MGNAMYSDKMYCYDTLETCEFIIKRVGAIIHENGIVFFMIFAGQTLFLFMNDTPNDTPNDTQMICPSQVTRKTISHNLLGSAGCGKYECIYVDKCNTQAGYACLPFDFRYFMWLLVGIFLVVVLVCSSIVVCYLLRAIRASFRNTVGTEGDIVFYNAQNVHAFPHPANMKSIDDYPRRHTSSTKY